MVVSCNKMECSVVLCHFVRVTGGSPTRNTFLHMIIIYAYEAQELLAEGIQKRGDAPLRDAAELWNPRPEYSVDC